MEGIILTLTFLLYIFISYLLAKKSFEDTHEQPSSKKPVYDIIAIIFGLAGLIGGSKIAVIGAVDIAEAFGVSKLLIGLTVVAIGTSLPEIAASSVATYKGKSDIAVGNVLGSNITNTFLILGICALYCDDGFLDIDPTVLVRDLPVMVGATLICFPIFFTKYAVVRWEGVFLLSSYILYVANCAMHDTVVHTTSILNQVTFYFTIFFAIALTISFCLELVRRYRRKNCHNKI